VSRIFVLMVHLAAVAAWLAGLFAHLARLGGPSRDAALARAHRRYRRLTRPAMGIAVTTGAALIAADARYYRHCGWLYAKLLAAALLVAATVHIGRSLRAIAGHHRPWFQALREGAALLVALIGLLLALRPW
jgi:uncharacterized membrane protein